MAANLAERHGARLESCAFPDRPETVEVTVAVPVAGPMGMLGPARGARAGAEHPEEEHTEEEHTVTVNAEELSPDEVAELEEELEAGQDSVPEPHEPETQPTRLLALTGSCHPNSPYAPNSPYTLARSTPPPCSATLLAVAPGRRAC